MDQLNGTSTGSYDGAMGEVEELTGSGSAKPTQSALSQVRDCGTHMKLVEGSRSLQPGRRVSGLLLPLPMRPSPCMSLTVVTVRLTP